MPVGAGGVGIDVIVGVVVGALGVEAGGTTGVEEGVAVTTIGEGVGWSV